MSKTGCPTSASSKRCAASACPPSRSESMPQLIKDGALAADRWTLLRDVPTLAHIPDGAPAIVPLSLWRERRAALRARGDVGVWLRPDDDPAELAVDVKALPLIAVDFPQF